MKKGSRARRCCLLVAVALPIACSKTSSPEPAPVASVAQVASSAPIVQQPEPRALPSAASVAANSGPATSAGEAPSGRYDDLNPASWSLSELSDVGPAGPATATPLGVVMVTMAGELLRGNWQASGVVAPIERPKSDFAAYGRGPGLAGAYAYWIRGQQLVRRRTKGNGELEVLSSDAREGTRVATALVGPQNKAVAAYIAQSGEELVARLWIEGGQRLSLTPEGSQATSVNLIPSNGDLLAVILEGRTSMSPVHARRLLVKGKIPRVGEDVVVWVGPPSQPLSEVVSLPNRRGDAWSFLALERTVTDFGLARFRVQREPQMDPKVSWIDYPNGINPAPVAVGSGCGKGLVAFARPSEARPRSPQELHLAELDDRTLQASEVVARSRAFNNISLAPVKGGVLITWTADWRTWALTAFCK